MLHKHYYPVLQCPETNLLFNFFIKIMSGKIFLRGTKVHLIIKNFSKKIMKIWTVFSLYILSLSLTITISPFPPSRTKP